MNVGDRVAVSAYRVSLFGTIAGDSGGIDMANRPMPLIDLDDGRRVWCSVGQVRPLERAS